MCRAGQENSCHDFPTLTYGGTDQQEGATTRGDFTRADRGRSRKSSGAQGMGVRRGPVRPPEAVRWFQPDPPHLLRGEWIRMPLRRGVPQDRGHPSR
jgi:hypothetical protein